MMTNARDISSMKETQVTKAWVNFDGTFVSSPFTEANGGIRDSFNVTSVSDIGVGLYDVNFEQGFDNANYSWAGSAGDTDATVSNGTVNCVRTGQMTSDKIRIVVNFASTSVNSAHDYKMVSLIVLGELS